MTECKKPIKKFEINIGHSFYTSDPMLTIIFNDHLTTCRLKDLKDWIDIIFQSNGNRSKEAYEAKKHLDQFFLSILFPIF